MTGAAAPRTLKGIALLVASMAVITVLDATAKYLSQRYPVLMVVWARYFFNVVLMLLWLGPRMGRSLIATRAPWRQFARGAMLVGSTILFFFSLSLLPLAEASAITYIAPVLVTLLAVHVYGERAPPGTWLALSVSFVGVLVIVRPGSDVFSWPALLPLATAFGFAGYQLLTSRLAGVDDRLATLFMGALVGVVVMSAIVPFVWERPASATDAGLFVLTGAVATLGHYLMIRAFEIAPASTLAPFVYSQVVATLTLGYLVFGDMPDGWSLLGMAMITGTGVAMALWNRRRVAPEKEKAA